MSEFNVWAGMAQVAISALMAWVALYIRAELSKLRLEISEHRLSEAAARANDKLETRNWINGSFMRSAHVESRLRDLADRLERSEGS